MTTSWRVSKQQKQRKTHVNILFLNCNSVFYNVLVSYLNIKCLNHYRLSNCFINRSLYISSTYKSTEF
ncbi:uncharacterized protein B0P05DRAFT_485556 [Gilbertella persicaria]|uniref:uncharacterized protein n=1 Tax=Gilbertella persicaria TaxID=101096 RepID=UPI00221F342A|nr:uncharacterized protein B0P05DRAFT_485556 [Gilbertella persicaria]KAI8091069.1 hypothetical protein B0P05DRAFT_485556 [Gilbertella persicaria]